MVLWLGDFNTRVSVGRAAADALVANGGWRMLLHADEMVVLRGPKQALAAFRELPLTHPPTYKYESDGVTWDDKRTPSWCDRVLWHARASHNVHAHNYRSMQTSSSDHRAVALDIGLSVGPLKQQQHDRARHVKQTQSLPVSAVSAISAMLSNADGLESDSNGSPTQSSQVSARKSDPNPFLNKQQPPPPPNELARQRAVSVAAPLNAHGENDSVNVRSNEAEQDAAAVAAAACKHFQVHQWQPNRCQHCRRPRDEHTT